MLKGRQNLIVGCGDIGVRVSRLIMEADGSVVGLARSDQSSERMRSLAIEPVVGNLDDLATLNDLPLSGRLVFYLAPPPGGGPFDTRMRNFCSAASHRQPPQKLIYISTSGVYGDCGGEWVTEETPVNPQTSRAKRRVDAEQTVTAWGRSQGVAVVILRVTGIYGPGRLPLARLQQGHPLLREDESPPTNRIHADDLARVCVAAVEKAEDGAIYNVSDGQPGTMTQYFNALADLFDLPRPPQITMEEARKVMSPMMLSYLTETRRMDNRRMIEDLGVSLQFPDLCAGLKNCVDQLEMPNMGYFGSLGH